MNYAFREDVAPVSAPKKLKRDCDVMHGYLTRIANECDKKESPVKLLKLVKSLANSALVLVEPMS